MKLALGGVIIQDNLDLNILPRVGDKISITDINGNKITYTVENVEFSFEDVGNTSAYGDNINYKSIVIVNVV